MLDAPFFLSYTLDGGSFGSFCLLLLGIGTGWDGFGMVQSGWLAYSRRRFLLCIYGPDLYFLPLWKWGSWQAGVMNAYLYNNFGKNVWFDDLVILVC